jgi:hypothetical protein
MKFFLKKSFISANIPSIAGRAMAAGREEDAKRSGAKPRPAMDGMLVEKRRAL